MSNNQITKINTDTGVVELSPNIVRNNIAAGDDITDQEIHNFIQLCVYRRLNPFLGQAHIVKFGGKKARAQLITSKDVFISRMNNHPKCRGWNSGIILLNKDNEVIERRGTFYLKETEKLVGAWFKANIDGWETKSEHTINLSDYLRTYKKDGKTLPMGQWGIMPAVMLEKCVIVAGIRKTFPEEFGGMYTEDELGIDKANAIDANYTVIDNDKETIRRKSNLLGDNQNKGKMQQLCIAAKSTKIEFDSNKLLDYAMEQLVKSGNLKSKSKKDIPMSKFDKVLEYVKSLVSKKEKKAAESTKNKEESKNNILTEEEKEKRMEAANREIFTEDGLPLANDNFAKPANGKEDKGKNGK